MQLILSDHNCEGQAEAIFQVLRREDYLSLSPMQLVLFRDLGLRFNLADEVVWQTCQKNGYLLLTGNRTATAKERSLEFAVRRLVKEDSLPVITISNLNRVKPDPDYCHQCAVSLVEIVLGLHKLRGIRRLFIPFRGRLV